jgi:hypothetical protein
LAVIAGMLGVTLIGASRLRARRRRTAQAGASGWAPAVAGGAAFATAAPTGRWGEARTPAADFDDWHDEEPAAAAAPAATGAPFTLEPDLEELGEDDLDAVFAGRSPAPAARGESGRFGQETAPLVPDARSIFEDGPVRPRGGAAGFGSAPRRSGGLGGPAVRAAAYAAVGIALVAVIVNVALSGGEDAQPTAAPAPRTQAPAPPAPTPAGPTPEQVAAARDAAAALRTDALAAVAAAERRARSAERRRVAAAKRRRAAANRRRSTSAAPITPAAPVVPVTPSNPTPRAPSGGGSGGGGGGTACDFGCIG